jgi:hypothetical protein
LRGELPGQHQWAGSVNMAPNMIVQLGIYNGKKFSILSLGNVG